VQRKKVLIRTAEKRAKEIYFHKSSGEAVRRKSVLMSTGEAVCKKSVLIRAAAKRMEDVTNSCSSILRRVSQQD
jgi:hypothetical protein